MPNGDALGLPTWEKPRVRPAVVAHGQRAVTQVNDLHRVRMTLHAERVIMIPSVRRCGGARCYVGHPCSTRYLIHDPPPLHPFAGLLTNTNLTLQVGGSGTFRNI